MNVCARQGRKRGVYSWAHGARDCGVGPSRRETGTEGSAHFITRRHNGLKIRR